ncbi:MAG TPA: hypothetical protein VIJ47_14220, partial [Acidimicrobiales bacterium]
GAYRKFWDVWMEANDPPNPEYASLAEVATKGQLELARSKITSHREDHLLYRDRPMSVRAHRINVVSKSPDQIVLRDCNLDDGLVLDSRTLEVTNDAVSTHLWDATMTKEGGTWKLADNEQIQKWAGPSDCGGG